MDLDDLDLTNAKVKRKIKGFQFAEEIVVKHPWGFIGGIIYGPRRIGKSVYALKVMQQVFMAFGFSKEEAWRLAINSLFFDVQKLLMRINQLASERKVWPVICLDDAGVGAGSHKWFTERGTVYALSGVFDTVGTVVSGFIMTTPNFERILGFIRDAEDFYRIVIKVTGTGISHWQREANAYRIRILPSGTKRIRSKHTKHGGFVDEFSAHLTNEKYGEYANIRWPYTVQATESALGRMKERPKKLPKGSRKELMELKEIIDTALEEVKS